MSKQTYNIDWIIPKLRNPSSLWGIASTITMVAVGLFSKILIFFPVTGWLNRTKVHRKPEIVDLMSRRAKNVPLITVSNHHSCFDDPGIWGSLKLRHLLSRKKMRWALAAHDICFTCAPHAIFFALGKCIPVIRGSGVYQDAVDFCIERLASGEWVHVFPEGKVNMTKEFMRMKWGVGRMVFESPVTPVVLPVWHIGMDDVLPNDPPYILKIGKNLTFNYGQPIDLSDLVRRLKEEKASDEEARKRITDVIQEALYSLKEETEELHRLHFFKNPS